MAYEYYFWANHDGKVIDVRLSYFYVFLGGQKMQFLQRGAISTGNVTMAYIGVPLKSQSWEFQYAYLMDVRIMKAFINEINKARGGATRSSVKYRLEDIEIFSIGEKTEVIDVCLSCSSPIVEGIA